MATIAIVSCVRQLPAPIVDRSTAEDSRWETYTVRENDTLYTIAWRHDLDYEALAEANGIEPPYIIRPGQRLVLVGRQVRGAQPTAATPATNAPAAVAATTQPRKAEAPAWQPVQQPQKAAPDAAEPADLAASTAQAGPAAKPAAPALAAQPPKPEAAPPRNAPKKPVAATPPAPAAAAQPAAAPKAGAAPGWRQPVATAPARVFGGASKGHDYVLAPATRVFAAHGGEVAYAGPGLGGFRHTFIVKVGDRYLVAYSLNAEPQLTEGDTIATGDVVAEIGSGGANAGRLHFEIRERGSGKAIDPAPLIGR